MNGRTDKFWYCKCPEYYVRRSNEHQCKVCGALKEEQPMARAEEVMPLVQEELMVLNELLKFQDICSVKDLKRRDELEDTLSDLEACHAT